MKKGILIILDGYGEGEKYDFNAVTNANTPFLHGLKRLPHALIKTCGEAVGLFKGDMGGSEVGHMTIGAGKHVLSEARAINQDFESGNFKKSKNLVSVAKQLKDNKGDLHLFGMMSDKNIHSNVTHAYALIDFFSNKARKIYFHIITDGRDCGIYDSFKYLKELKKHISSVKNCEIASIGGRYYAMDRENNLDRTLKGFNAAFGKSECIEADGIEEYISAQHKRVGSDEFIEPIKVKSSFESLSSSDAILFFNFREDRMRQITKMCEEKLPAKLVTMSEVGGTNSIVLYHKTLVKHTLCQYLSELNKSQIKISESTKYAHVTYFFNGGREEPFDREDRIHIPTKKTNDYAKTPKMRAKEITDEIIRAMGRNYDAIIANFSNPDMIGHTGNYNAAVKALEFIDKCLVKIVEKAKEKDYFIILTADHGNSEAMRHPDGTPHTTHTLNDVFLSVIDSVPHKIKKHGELCDVAPTMIKLMGLEDNPEFTGKSLVY